MLRILLDYTPEIVVHSVQNGSGPVCVHTVLRSTLKLASSPISVQLSAVPNAVKLEWGWYLSYIL